MKIRILKYLFVFISFSLITGLAQADFSINTWPYFRTISLPATTDFAKIIIPFDRGSIKKDFSDVRIVNQNFIETPYLISNNTSVDSGIHNVSIPNNSSSPVYSQNFPVSVFNNSTKHTTEVTVDLGNDGYLTNAIAITSADTNYNRRVAIDTSDDDQLWSDAGEGSISSISTSLFSGSSNKVYFSEQKKRFIRLSIVNNDNRTLSIGKIATVEGPATSLIFEVRPQETYSIYYGNKEATTPKYDISRISSYIEQNNIPAATLGPEIVNNSYVAPTGPIVPYTESHKWLLNIVLVFLVLIVGRVTIWYLKNYIKSGKDFK